MSFISGCQEGKATPRLKEIICPKCGEIVEVFVGMGAMNAGTIMSDEKCPKCGLEIAAQTPVSEYKEA